MRDAAYRAREAERARNKRQARAVAVGSKCRARLGPHAVCGTRLTQSVDWLGRLVMTCGACDRKRAGKCRLCPRPVYGKVGWAVYCRSCKKGVVLRAQNKRWISESRNYRHKLTLNRAYRRRKARMA